MTRWLTHHMQALRLVLSRLAHNRLSTLLIGLAIGVSLALPLILYLVLHSADTLVSAIKQDTHLSVFLKTDIQPDQLKAAQQTLEADPAIAAVRFVSKEEALTQLKIANNNDALISALDSNPLPDAFFIEPKALDATAVDSLKQRLSQLAGVDAVQVDDAWLNRLNYLLALGKKAMAVISLLLALALFAIIGNTVRMQILTQQEEIEVSQLIGATNRFIRRPFLYAGAIYGLIGGLFALLITVAVIMMFNQSLSALSATYQTSFQLGLPGLSLCMASCAVAVVIGMVSAYLAVSKSLFRRLL